MRKAARNIGLAAAVSALLLGQTGLTTVLAEGETQPAQGENNGQGGQTPPDGEGMGQGGEAPDGQAPDGMPGGEGGAPGGGASSAVTEWDSVYAYDSDTTEDDGTYDSTGLDENVIHVSGGNVVLNNPTVTRFSTESQGGDDSSFYGVGAAILTTDGTTYVNGGEIETDANGAAGVFSYGDGVSYVAGTTISTTGNTAGGLHVAGGGTLYAWDVTATTQGESSAAIRSDRGGGTMVIDGGTYTSNGTGSPAVYVTADITINDAELVANGSEGLALEGLNTVRLFNSNLTSNMADLDQNDSTWSIILYQSMSGDSEVGAGYFYMIDGSITSNNGGLFYTTNTESNFYLENVAITTSDDSEYFLRVSGNANERGWGTTGANGSQTNFTAVSQVMEGDVYWDSISELDFYMQNSSSLTGAIIDDETYAGEGGDGYANVYIDSSSTWTVTGDSTVTNLYNEGTITDASGNTVTIVGTDGTTYVDGDSEYTITVSGTYSTTADFSGALTSVSYDDYKVEKPEVLTAVSTSETADAETVETVEETVETTETAEETDSNSVTYVVAGIAVIAIAAVCVVLAKRKK